MKKFRKILSLITVIVFMMSISGSTYALDKGTDQIDVLESVQFLEDKEVGKADKIETGAGIFGNLYDDKGKLVVPNKKNLKEKFMAHFNQDPVKYAEGIKNVDALVDETYNLLKNAKDKGVISQDFRLYPHTHYWLNNPQIYKTETWLTYNSWIGIDNYRSAVPMTLTSEKSTSCSASIGFSGDVDLKAKLGFQAAVSISQQATMKVGASCPAWTVWDMRPYIKYRKDFWKGIYVCEYYNPITDTTTWEYPTKYGVNNVLIVKNTEGWSRYNSNHSLTATTPTPPTTPPNI